MPGDDAPQAHAGTGASTTASSRPFTRKEFYDLAFDLRAWANQLASCDPRRVNLKHCHRFNDWLRQLRRFDLLAPTIATIKPARPVARWQAMALYVIFWLIVYMWTMGRMQGMAQMVLLNSLALGFLTFFFIPERVFGTTVEEIEAKTLRIVQAMETMLLSNQVDFSEAAFYKAKEALEGARLELRQQLDLAHRN